MIHYLALFATLFFQSPTWAVNRTVTIMPTETHCFSIMQTITHPIVNNSRLDQVLLSYKNEEGSEGEVAFPNGVQSRGFKYGAYVRRDDDERVVTFGNESVKYTSLLLGLIPLAELRGLSVLEYPSGKGLFVDRLSAKGVNIYGTEVFIPKSSAAKNRVLPGNYSWTPFNESSLDLVLSIKNPWISETNTEETIAYLEEVRRILKPGARLLVYINSHSQSFRFANILSHVKGLVFEEFHDGDKGGFLEIRKQVEEQPGMT